MSMSYSEDHPLFAKADASEENSNKEERTKTRGSLEVIETEADIKRKDKILSFAFILLRYFLIACGGLVILEILSEKLKLSSSLTVEFFDLLKYSITSILGYLFASEHKR